jgi:hypothetical protein
MPPDAYFQELLAAYTNVCRMIDGLPTNRPRGACHDCPLSD